MPWDAVSHTTLDSAKNVRTVTCDFDDVSFETYEMALIFMFLVNDFDAFQSTIDVATGQICDIFCFPFSCDFDDRVSAM